MSDWPNPDAPGVPLNPERDGHHWLMGVPGIPLAPYWDERAYAWAAPGLRAVLPGEVAEYIYLGPCLTPAEADAIRAENARLREALLDAQGPMYVEFVRRLPVFRCEEEP
jgi:hypothetical protein